MGAPAIVGRQASWLAGWLAGRRTEELSIGPVRLVVFGNWWPLRMYTAHLTQSICAHVVVALVALTFATPLAHTAALAAGSVRVCKLCALYRPKCVVSIAQRVLFAATRKRASELWCSQFALIQLVCLLTCLLVVLI